MAAITCISVGCAMGFYHGNVFKIKEDLGSLRPTIFVSVPRLWNRLHDEVISKIADSAIH
jgi:long-chain acyl-CoA synthetase